jgi:hypothetical protein
VETGHSTTPTAQLYPPAFLRAVEKLLTHEGGYSNDPRDRGGETKFGICGREYPQLTLRR